MKKFFLFALAALMFAACNDTKQTELTEEILGLTGKSAIRVQFFYNPGSRLVDGVEVTELLPVPDGVVVFAKVDYSQYTGAKEEGKSYKQFEATKKGNGVYEVEIPAGEKAIAVTMVANGFEADYFVNPTKAIKAYYPKKEVEIGNVLAGQSFVEIDPNKTTFQVDKNILNNDRTVEIKEISGKLTGNVEKWNDDKGGYVESKEAAIANREVELEIKAKDGSADERALVFTAKTDANGVFAFKNIMIYDAWKDSIEKDETSIEMKLSVKQWADGEFVHYYKLLQGSRATEFWADEAAYKTAKASCADDDAWLDYLGGLNFVEDEKAKYLYAWDQATKQSVLGSWEVADRKIGNMTNVVILFQQALNQDLKASFSPENVNNVYGVGLFSNGEVQKVKCKNDDKVEVPFTVKSNTMGWK